MKGLITLICFIISMAPSSQYVAKDIQHDGMTREYLEDAPKINTGAQSIDMLNNGIYSLLYNLSNGQVIQHKVIIQ